MTALLVLAGLSLGAAGAIAHLAVTQIRARRTLAEGPVFALVSFPVGLVGPALAVIAAAHVSPLSAWVSPLGLCAARSLFLLSRGRP